jgi:aspartokinase/homoserine dehydrogenase 1
MLIVGNPIKLSCWKTSVENDGEKSDFQKFVDKMLLLNMENSVFIDVTAADEPVEYYSKLLSSNISIVAANKRANTQSLEQYHKLHDAAKKRNVSFHYETNVGAGLPVIDLIRKIIAGGDKVIKIEAILSGTINWLLSEYDGSKTLSELIRQAMAKGYAEHDPRDDLSGVDVARKCLILARECDFNLELDNIPVDSLMPPEAAKAENLSAFFRAMKNFDSKFHDQYTTAITGRKKMYYVANIENGTAKVELLGVEETHPFFTMNGSEICIILTTKYYQQSPMVIKGPGAGVDVTAAGLLADIVRIAEEIRM